MVSIDDPEGYGEKFRWELEQIEHYPEPDQPYVRQFVNRLDGRLKESSLGLYLQNLRLTAEYADRPLSEFDRDAFEQLTFDLRHDEALGNGDSGLSDSTVKNRQNAVVRFFEEADLDERWTRDVMLVKPEKTKVRPEDMLRAEHIQALCDGANNMRDVALIEFFADTGVRRGLAASLRVGDVDLDGDRPTFTPNDNAKGLKGAEIREYPLIDSRATLRTYLDRIHPRPEDDGVAFFHAIPGHGTEEFNGDGAIDPHTIYDQLARAAKNGDVEKPVNPHNFRHSAITRMRKEGYDRAEVETRVCWVVDSEMWEVYEHISAEEANEAMFERAGMIEETEENSAERRRCGDCLELVAPHHLRCPRCGRPVDPELRDLAEQVDDEGSDQMAFSDDELERMVERAILKMHRRGDLEVDPEDADA